MAIGVDLKSHWLVDCWAAVLEQSLQSWPQIQLPGSSFGSSGSLISPTCSSTFPSLSYSRVTSLQVGLKWSNTTTWTSRVNSGQDLLPSCRRSWQEERGHLQAEPLGPHRVLAMCLQCVLRKEDQEVFAWPLSQHETLLHWEISQKCNELQGKCNPNHQPNPRV